MKLTLSLHFGATILSMLLGHSTPFQMQRPKIVGGDGTRMSAITSRTHASIGTKTKLNVMNDKILDRRKIMHNLATFVAGGVSSSAVLSGGGIANAYDDAALGSEQYDNPNMPAGPEERSGLVVLRVAEVCNFQEKIIRAVVSKDIDTVIAPQQIVFGNQVMIRNSNIAGNMKLMIDTEIQKENKNNAIKSAVVIMNTLQSISVAAGKVQRPFTDDEMLEIADLYRLARLQLNNMYEFLPSSGKEKYYGYFMQVTEYEKKIAEGVYNPELDGVLNLAYDN